MSITDAQTKAMIAVAAVAVALVVYLRARGARDVGASAVRAVDNAIGGAVQEFGAVFGVPKTDDSKCADAQRDGRTFDASLYCPAGTFIRGLFAPRASAGSDPYVAGGYAGLTQADIDDWDTGAAARAMAQGIDYVGAADVEDYDMGQTWATQPYRTDYRLAGRYKGMVGR